MPTPPPSTSPTHMSRTCPCCMPNYYRSSKSDKLIKVYVAIMPMPHAHPLPTIVTPITLSSFMSRLCSNPMPFDYRLSSSPTNPCIMHRAPSLKLYLISSRAPSPTVSHNQNRTEFDILG